MNYRRVHRMSYCKRCHGKYQAEVEVTAKDYGEDTYITYKVIKCQCYDLQILSVGGDNPVNRTPKQSVLPNL